MPGISYLCRLSLNIMIAILAFTAIQESTMSQVHAWRTFRWPLPAAQQWRQLHSCTACHKFSMLRRVSSQWPKNKCQGSPDILEKGLAGLGWMGKPGVATGSGCCRSTGRVPVMKQSDHGSAIVQMKRWLFRLRAGNLDPSI
jgi:hypothetical protein